MIIILAVKKIDYMTPENLSDLSAQLTDYNEKLNDINDKYARKLSEIEEKINKVKNCVTNSDQYIQTQIDKLMAEMEETNAAIERKINSVTDGIQKWFKRQEDRIKLEIATFMIVKMGLPPNAVGAVETEDEESNGITPNTPTDTPTSTPSSPSKPNVPSNK